MLLLDVKAVFMSHSYGIGEDKREVKHLPLLRLARMINLARSYAVGSDYDRELLELLERRVEEKKIEGDGLDEFKSMAALEFHIRDLVAAGKDWKVLSPIVWKMKAYSSDMTVGARMIELAFLYGDMNDVTDIIKVLAPSGTDFYFKVSEKLRTYLGVKLRVEGYSHIIRLVLIENRKRVDLLPIERLIIFYQLLETGKKNDALMLCRQYELELVAAVHELGNRLKIDGGTHYFTKGQLAEDLGMASLAIRLFEKVPREHPIYQQALTKIINLKANDHRLDRYYITSLENKSQWTDRIQKFYDFLSDYRLNQGQGMRPSLNELFLDPLSWFPEVPKAWRSFSEMIVANSTMNEYLPHFFSIYHRHAVDFDSPSLDVALWEPVVNLKTNDKIFDSYLKGIAYLHLFQLLF